MDTRLCKNNFQKYHYILKYWKLNIGADLYFDLMEQEENIQLRRVILIIKLVKLKMSSSPFPLTTGYTCPERIHYVRKMSITALRLCFGGN